MDRPGVLLGGALLLRLTLFPTIPDLSDDLYRYVWDGWIGSSGINPFRYVPSHPALEGFRGTGLYESLNSPDYHSIYPPLSQLVFLAGGALYDAVGWPAAAYGIKAGFLVLEMGGVWFLYRALRAFGKPPHTLILYAWNPLVLVTLAGGGHSEAGLVLGMGLLGWSLGTDRRAWGWIGLVLAAASKGIPILLAPLLLRRDLRALGLRATCAALLPAALLGIALLAPFYFDGIVRSLSASADLYVRSFEFNAGIYSLLEGAGVLLTGQDWGRVIGPGLRWLFLATVVVVWARWPVRDAESLIRAGLAMMGLYLLTATTVHPWYLVWGLVWIPLTPFLRRPWLWASWAAFLTYFFYVGVPAAPLSAVFWGGIGGLLAVEWWPRIRDPLLRLAGRRKARQVEPHLQGRRILDLGAGEGYVASALARRGLRVFMTDVGSFYRVELPRVVYDGRHLPYSDDSVDTVLISLALHHAEDPEAVVREALRVAARRVVVTESTFRSGLELALLEKADRLVNRGRSMSADPEVPETLAFRTVERWERSFRALGAGILRSERLNRIGHRHHLFVLTPPTRQRDAAVRQNSPNPP